MRRKSFATSSATGRRRKTTQGPARTVALLAQADTAFEQPFLTTENKEHFILVRFPTGISGIRTAWESDVKPSSSQDDQGALKIPKTTLDVTLTDRSQPVHLLPETGTFTAASRDLAISNLLAVIGARQIDYIGIIASDPRDTLFLAERIRRLAPSKILFIVNSHLLFTHPSWAPLMNGTLVLSGYPLFAEGPRWRDNELERPAEGKYLRQFTSSFQQGIYRAVGSLRSDKRLPEGEQQLLWMSVIGNSSLWPLACLGPTPPVLSVGPIPTPSYTGERIGDELPSRSNTKLIWLSLALCLLAAVLIALGEVPLCARRDALLPILVGPFALWMTGGGLAVLGALPYVHLGVPFSWARDWRLSIAGGLMVLLLALLSRFAASTWRLALWGWWFLGFLVGGALLFYPLDRALSVLWMPGGAEHFYQRAFVLSSGLSPLVSLAWLGGALYLWSLAELRRYRMTLRQKLCPPIPIGFRAREGDSAAFDSLEETISGSLPWLRQFPWVALIPAIPAVVLIRLPLRPIAETGTYGHLFSCLLGLTLFLGAFSFCRFLCTWMILRKILQRLGLPHPPRGLDRDLAKMVSWKPMKSFGWQIPCFGSSTIQAVDCLEELGEAGMLWNTGIQPKEIREYLEKAMDAERENDLEREVEKREEVDSLLCSANGTLAGRDDALTRRFYALRLISYIRYMFAHLRAFLIAALACGFPLLAAASTYAYEPNEYVTNSIWSVLLIAVLLTLAVFFQMDRIEVLSTIADTTPGEVSFNLDLVVGTVTYGIVPLLGLIVAQFPNVGRYFVTLLNPLVRALGAV